jgi:hypothetical protein
MRVVMSEVISSRMGHVTRQLRSRGAIAAFLAAVLAASVAPNLDHAHERPSISGTDFPGWPTHYEDRPLTELPLTAREAAFMRDFPGRVGRFSDGRREIIVRWVGAPTRRLHAAADCFRGSGYAVTSLPVKRDAAGAAMGWFRAILGGTGDMIVCELIRGNHGESWPDVSAWYWSAMFGSSAAPWWSFVVAEKE